MEIKMYENWEEEKEVGRKKDIKTFFVITVISILLVTFLDCCFYYKELVHNYHNMRFVPIVFELIFVSFVCFLGWVMFSSENKARNEKYYIAEIISKNQVNECILLEIVNGEAIIRLCGENGFEEIATVCCVMKPDIEDSVFDVKEKQVVIPLR